MALAAVLGKVRPLVRSQPGTADEHKRVFELLIDSELIEAIRAGNRGMAEDILFQALGQRIDLSEVIPWA